MKEIPPVYAEPAPGAFARARRLVPRALVPASAVYLLSNILLAVIPFALLPVLTRYLSPAEYGQVAMFQALLAGLGAFVGIGIAAAAARKHFDKETTAESQREFIGSCLQVLLLSTMVVGVVTAFLREPLSRLLGLDGLWIAWGVPVAAAGVLVQLRLSIWQVRHCAFRYGAFQVGQSLLNVALSLLLVVGFALGAPGRISAQSAAVVVFAGFAVALFWRDRLVVLRAWRPDYVREVLAYGIPLLPHVLAAFLLFSIDRVVINAELGLAEAGVYMVGAQLASAVSLVFDAASRAYMPWLFERLERGDPAEKREVVRSTYSWFAIILATAACVFVLGPKVVVLIAGARYERAGSVIGWLVLGQAFLGMYLLLSSYLMYTKRTGLLSTVTVTSALIYLALLTVLVPRFGLQGAATGFALAMGLRLAFTWWAANRSYPMPWLAFRSSH